MKEFFEKVQKLANLRTLGETIKINIESGDNDWYCEFEIIVNSDKIAKVTALTTDNDYTECECEGDLSLISGNFYTE